MFTRVTITCGEFEHGFRELGINQWELLFVFGNNSRISHTRIPSIGAETVGISNENLGNYTSIYGNFHQHMGIIVCILVIIPTFLPHEFPFIVPRKEPRKATFIAIFFQSWKF